MASATDNPHAGSSAGRPGKMLVLHGEQAVATELGSRLEESGFLVIGATANAERGLETCRVAHPDVVVADVDLLTGEGASIARTIRDELGIAVVPAVLPGATSDGHDAETAIEAAAFGFLMEPLSVETLEAAVMHVWEQHHEATEQTKRIEKLEKRLEDRKTIEQAKWILVERLGIAEPDAMKRLQRKARNERRPLVDVATSIIETSDFCDVQRLAS